MRLDTEADGGESIPDTGKERNERSSPCPVLRSCVPQKGTISWARPVIVNVPRRIYGLSATPPALDYPADNVDAREDTTEETKCTVKIRPVKQSNGVITRIVGRVRRRTIYPVVWLTGSISIAPLNM